MSITSSSKKETSSPTKNSDPIGIIGQSATLSTSISLKPLRDLSLKFKDGEIIIRLRDGEMQYVTQTTSNGSVKREGIIKPICTLNSSSLPTNEQEPKKSLGTWEFEKKTL